MTLFSFLHISYRLLVTGNRRAIYVWKSFADLFQHPWSRLVENSAHLDGIKTQETKFSSGSISNVDVRTIVNGSEKAAYI